MKRFATILVGPLLPYDPLKDFTPVSLVATQNLMLLVHPSVPAKSVRELVRFAKSQPGKLSFASAGNGTGSHLSGELFRQLAGVDILHVPYKGVAPGLVDTILKHPDTNERLSKEGADPVGSSPQEFGQFMQREIEKWRKVIRTAGIEPS